MDKMRLGAQMFTVHDHVKDLAGFEDALKRIADIGYEFVQVSGTCPYEPEWLAEQLKATGLKCTLTHTNADRMATETEAVIADHNIFNCDHIGLGGYLLHQQGVDSFIDKYLEAAKKMDAAGKRFTYHNHDWEFIKLDGKPLLAHVAERFPKELLAFTVDTFWVQAGGGDPAEWLTKLAGRIDTIHFKDMVYDPTDLAVRMAPVGSGNINHVAAARAAEAGGTKYVFVEQDRCYDEDPFVCMKKSYDYLKGIGLE